MKKKMQYLFTLSIVIYTGIELICFVFIKTGYIPASLPTFRYQKEIATYPFQIADINPIWGTWHYPGQHHYQIECLNFDYFNNSYGARDKERKKISDTGRYVVLGDSFTEGYGLEENERFTNLLEAKTGKEFMNFSCSDFGPVQELLIYKHLAASFSHSTVIINFLPFNDFKDCDTSDSDKDNFERYRPYFFKLDGAYRLVYKEKTIEQSTFNREYFLLQEKTFKKKLAKGIKAFSFWGNIDSGLKHSAAEKQRINKESYYYNYSSEEIEKFFFVMRQLKKEAQNKKIILVALPVLEDIIAYRKSGEGKLSKDLRLFCKTENIQLIDLLPFLSKQQSNLYLPCDHHWNADANKLVANYLFHQIR
ncbi:MAG: hypothetical protein ABL872_08420 [Lacibacter sp.]